MQRLPVSVRAVLREETMLFSFLACLGYEEEEVVGTAPVTEPATNVSGRPQAPARTEGFALETTLEYSGMKFFQLSVR